MLIIYLLYHINNILSQTKVNVIHLFLITFPDNDTCKLPTILHYSNYVWNNHKCSYSIYYIILKCIELNQSKCDSFISSLFLIIFPDDETYKILTILHNNINVWNNHKCSYSIHYMIIKIYWAKLYLIFFIYF